MNTHDRNWLSFVATTDTVVDRFTPPERPADYDDLLKGSDCTRLTVRGVAIPGGSREDAIDFVRGQDYRIEDSVVGGSITLKGSINGWRVANCELHGQVEVGQFDNYWYPGRPPTRNGLIVNCIHPGSKVKVVLWDAEKPNVVATDVQVTKIPWVIWFPYFLFRYVAIRTWDKPS